MGENFKKPNQFVIGTTGNHFQCFICLVAKLRPAGVWILFFWLNFLVWRSMFLFFLSRLPLERLQASFLCLAHWDDFKDSTWARMPQRAATAFGLLGGCRTTCPLLFLGRRPLLATTLEMLSKEDSEMLLSSPELPREQWLLYTDILGCSIKRFSISDIGIWDLGPPCTLTINQSSSFAGAVSSSISCVDSPSSGWEDPNR